MDKPECQHTRFSSRGECWDCLQPAPAIIKDLQRKIHHLEHVRRLNGNMRNWIAVNVHVPEDAMRRPISKAGVFEEEYRMDMKLTCSAFAVTREHAVQMIVEEYNNLFRNAFIEEGQSNG